MYELIILSLLMRWNAHGYLIASVINDIIGPYAKMSNGRLYPLLAKLEEQGLIEAFVESERASHGDRQHRSYAITEAGRKRFHDLMLDTTSNPGDYQKLFLQKVTVLELLNPAERLYLIDHYINYCQAHVLHLTAEAEHLVSDVNDREYMKASQLEAIVNVMHHMIEQWRLELEWARNLRKKEVLQAEGQEVL
ncbi:MAG TPA: PadR family transcriptional regulator [Ktedonobacteraceae bacterium]|nr:PadR family transcriptional regulator [Ktedonobacteraceae bacterium]